MVERRGNPADRRCWHLHLTSQSRPLLAEIDAQLNDLASTVCSGLDGSKKNTIAKSLHHMRDIISQELRHAQPAPTEKVA
jgi:DNA-binding MarR family transcriptional regulator